MRGDSPRNRSGRLIKFCAVAGLVFITSAGCGNDDQTELVTTTSRVFTIAPSTTTAPAPETTTTAVSSTTDAVSEETTGTSAPDAQTDAPETSRIFEYRVVRRESTRDGSRLFLEIPPGAYTDIDLQNLVESVYEERDDLYELHVFDNRDAVEALVMAEGERSAEETELLDRHYLVSLLEGSILRFQGPFADLKGFIIGS